MFGYRWEGCADEHALLRPRIVLALLAFLVAILAHRSLHAKRLRSLLLQMAERTFLELPILAFVTRANATIVHSQTHSTELLQATSNVVCNENVSQTIVGN